MVHLWLKKCGVECGLGALYLRSKCGLVRRRNENRHIWGDKRGVGVRFKGAV